MNNDQSFLGTEPVGRLLMRLAVPTVIAQLVNMLYNIVDRIYIGHMPGDGSLALTGVGVCMPIIMIVTAFAALIASGGAPRASIALGRGDRDTAERLLGNCFTLQIIISLTLTVILRLFGRGFLLAFGASENTIEYAVNYLNIYALGTLFVELTLGMNAFITAQGFATTGMLTVLIGAVCNIALDPLFIFGLKMGVRGAALATVISQGVSCLWVVSFLRGKKTSLRLKKENLKINWKLILPCLALGLSTFIMQSTESIISVCFNSSLLKYGGDIAVGAMTILTSVMQFAMLPLQGLAQGAQPISSYNFGAKNASRVKETFFALLKSSLTYSVLLWAGIMLFPKAFAGIFTPDAELLAFTAKALRIYCGALFIFGIQIACQMTFVSIGNAPCSIIVAILRKFVLLIPLIFILPHILPDPTMAVYTAEPVADTLAVLFTMIMFGTQFKKALKKLENASARFHISRLEAVQTGIQQQLELLYGNQVDSLDALLKKVVGNGYTHTAFEVQKGVGLGWDITGLDQKKLETLLSKPWTTDGRTFRDRCWLNKNDLVGSVSKSLTQGLLRGDSPAKITAAIQKQFGVHRYKAGRLVNTETTYFNAVATKECYKDLDVEMVEIIETLDSHTCSICGGLDGKVIPVSLN